MTQENPTPTEGSSPQTPPPSTEQATPQGEAINASESERTSAALCHYLNVIWLVPLILYLTKKEESPLIRKEGGEALNFTLTCLIAHVVCSVTACLVVPAFLMLAIFVTQIVLGVIAGNRVKAGGTYVYPWRIQFIK